MLVPFLTVLLSVTGSFTMVLDVCSISDRSIYLVIPSQISLEGDITNFEDPTTGTNYPFEYTKDQREFVKNRTDNIRKLLRSLSSGHSTCGFSPLHLPVCLSIVGIPGAGSPLFFMTEELPVRETFPNIGIRKFAVYGEKVQSLTLWVLEYLIAITELEGRVPRSDPIIGYRWGECSTCESENSMYIVCRAVKNLVTTVTLTRHQTVHRVTTVSLTTVFISGETSVNSFINVSQTHHQTSIIVTYKTLSVGTTTHITHHTNMSNTQEVESSVTHKLSIVALLLVLPIWLVILSLVGYHIYHKYHSISPI